MRIALGLLICVGCGGYEGTSKEGVYMVATWTRNANACDVEGSPVSNQPFFYVKNEKFLGVRFVNVNSCTDVEMCKMEARDDDTLHLGGFTFDQGGDSEGWTSRNAFAFETNGQCMGGVTESKLTFSGTSLRIEERHFEATPFPPSTGEDECPDEKVEDAAANAPCDEFEVVTANFDSKY